jgi:non-ribosomal peptide synthetase component F
MSEPQIRREEGAGPSRRQLLFQRLKEKKEATLGSAGSAIPRLGQTSAELSYAQQRLWVLEQMDPGNPRFCILTAMRLRGEVDLGALAATIREVVRRHEILRTAFAGEDGRPRQVIAPYLEVGLPRVDLSGLSEDVREPLLARLLTSEAQRPFDLARPPLVRAFVVRLGPAEHAVVLAQHQITVDRWSRGIIVRELTGLYAAFAAGRPSPLPESALHYADFSAWQRERLRGETLDGLLGYWRRQLADSPPLELPTDRPRPPVQRFHGALRYSVIPRPLLDRLQAFSQAEGATLFMTLLAAFAAVLHRWSGQDDVVVGSPIANRNQKQAEELLGFFVNMLALRTGLRGDLTFRELVGRAKEVALGAFVHQDLPFELLVRELSLHQDIPRDLSRHPLFQTSLVLQNAPMPPLELPGLTLSLLEVDWGTTAYDLALFFWETALWENLEEGLSLVASYSTDLYDASTIARLVGHLERLLAAAMDDPGGRLRDLEILAPAERRQLLGDWSRGAEETMPETPHEPLHSLVEARAAARPDAPAVDCSAAGEAGATYAELVRRAHQLARHLRRLGVGPESPVALAFPPSLDLVVSSLATLAAGGACLPVDPELPAERIALLLADSRAAAVVTRGGLEARLPAGLSLPVVRLDHDAAAISGESGTPLGLPVDLDALAYLLYTSGSTGRPKGVGIPHRSVVRMAWSPEGPSRLSPEDRVAHAASPSFDAALWEIWAPLLAGACLVGIDKDALLSPQRLDAELAARRASALFVPTALLHTLAGEAPSAFNGLRLLLFGGEMADPVAVRAVLGAFGGGLESRAAAASPPWPPSPIAPPSAGRGGNGEPDRASLRQEKSGGGRPSPGGRGGDGRGDGGEVSRLVHLYGPTEATTYATLQEIGDLPPQAAAVPVGRPAPGRRVYVLDAGLAPVPLGVDGEVWIGGDGLARGYLGAPDATAARFLPDPFSGIPGGRLYRTGDLGRLRPGGALEIRGRADEQVKVRGFRIEPGEVRAALTRHPAVREAAVVARDGRLEAFAVPRSGMETPAPGAILADLRRWLPAWMVPSRLVLLPALPRTAMGKVDLRALPDSKDIRDSKDETPLSPAEAAVAEIWREALGRAVSRIEDDFFALGGQSLDAARVTSRAGRAFGVDLTVRALYEAPTVGAFAARLTEQNPEDPR